MTQLLTLRGFKYMDRITISRYKNRGICTENIAIQLKMKGYSNFYIQYLTRFYFI